MRYMTVRRHNWWILNCIHLYVIYPFDASEMAKLVQTYLSGLWFVGAQYFDNSSIKRNHHSVICKETPPHYKTVVRNLHLNEFSTWQECLYLFLFDHIEIIVLILGILGHLRIEKIKKIMHQNIDKASLGEHYGMYNYCVLKLLSGLNFW